MGKLLNSQRPFLSQISTLVMGKCPVDGRVLAYNEYMSNHQAATRYLQGRHACVVANCLHAAAQRKENSYFYFAEVRNGGRMMY